MHTGKAVNQKMQVYEKKGGSMLRVKITLSCCMPIQIAVALWFLGKVGGQAGFKGEALLKERDWNAV